MTCKVRNGEWALRISLSLGAGGREYEEKSTPLKFTLNEESTPLGKFPHDTTGEISLNIMNISIVKLKGKKNREGERILKFPLRLSNLEEVAWYICGLQSYGVFHRDSGAKSFDASSQVSPKRTQETMHLSVVTQ